jgi:maltose alpha-D-glucosyltransferase/alpha-amylase
VNVASQKENPSSLLNTLRRMIAIRKEHPTFGWGSFAWVEGATSAVAAYLRSYRGETLLFANNLSSAPQSAVLRLPGYEAVVPVELFSGNPLPAVENEQLRLHLEPYGYLWLKL